MPVQTQLSCFLIKFCFDSLCLLGFYYYFQFHFLFFWDFGLALYARSWNLNEFFISLSALAFAAFCFAFAKLLHVVELYINVLRSIYVYSMLLFD